MDDSTLASLPTSLDEALPLVPVLTILWHPQVDRVGQMAPLTELLDGSTVSLDRATPTFAAPGSADGAPLDHRAISLKYPSFQIERSRGGYYLAAGSAPTELLVNGQPFTGKRALSASDLRAGVIVSVAKRIALCLHLARFPITRSPDLGLLGSGDAIEDVRRDVKRVADGNATVLIRGETGTGKELVARALHLQSRRASGPFVAVNMSTLRPERAAADLFGHEKGAFTGASDARPGLFRAAHGGTLFLDEIAETATDVQPMLLRDLLDHCVQPVGASHQPRTIDVRVISATDARLEEAMASGRFRNTLYERLNGYGIELPPLRARREDFGVVFLHFLRTALSKTGDLSRLDEPPGDASPWPSSRLVAQLACGPWVGNFRELDNLAGRFALWNAKSPRTMREIAAPFLASIPSQPTVSLLSSRDLSRDELLRALERNNWNRTRTAKALKIARETLRTVIVREPDIHRLIEIPIDNLLNEHDQCDGDLGELSRRLGIEAPLLRRRLPRSSV